MSKILVVLLTMALAMFLAVWLPFAIHNSYLNRGHCRDNTVILDIQVKEDIDGYSKWSNRCHNFSGWSNRGHNFSGYHCNNR